LNIPWVFSLYKNSFPPYKTTKPIIILSKIIVYIFLYIRITTEVMNSPVNKEEYIILFITNALIAFVMNNAHE